MNPIFKKLPSEVLANLDHCQGRYLQRLDDEKTPDKITSCCLVGALYLAAGWADNHHRSIHVESNDAGEDLMNDVVKGWVDETGREFQNLGEIITWNDTHTKEEALQLLKHNGH